MTPDSITADLCGFRAGGVRVPDGCCVWLPSLWTFTLYTLRALHAGGAMNA